MERRFTGIRSMQALKFTVKLEHIPLCAAVKTAVGIFNLPILADAEIHLPPPVPAERAYHRKITVAYRAVPKPFNGKKVRHVSYGKWRDEHSTSPHCQSGAGLFSCAASLYLFLIMPPVSLYRPPLFPNGYGSIR